MESGGLLKVRRGLYSRHGRARAGAKKAAPFHAQVWGVPVHRRRGCRHSGSSRFRDGAVDES
jgi:hypothetical protein